MKWNPSLLDISAPAPELANAHVNRHSHASEPALIQNKGKEVDEVKPRIHRYTLNWTEIDPTEPNLNCHKSQRFIDYTYIGYVSLGMYFQSFCRLNPHFCHPLYLQNTKYDYSELLTWLPSTSRPDSLPRILLDARNSSVHSVLVVVIAY